MQGRQGHGLLRRVAREVRPDLLADLFAQYRHLVWVVRWLGGWVAVGSSGGSVFNHLTTQQPNNLSVQLRRNDVQAPQHRDHVGQLVPLDEVWEQLEVD